MVLQFLSTFFPNWLSGFFTLQYFSHTERISISEPSKVKQQIYIPTYQTQTSYYNCLLYYNDPYIVNGFDPGGFMLKWQSGLSKILYRHNNNWCHCDLHPTRVSYEANLQTLQPKLDTSYILNSLVGYKLPYSTVFCLY